MQIFDLIFLFVQKVGFAAYTLAVVFISPIFILHLSFVVLILIVHRTLMIHIIPISIGIIFVILGIVKIIF